MFDKANFPRLAAQAAIFGAPPLKDFYDTASDELDAAIREQEEAERRRKQARARLGDFFFSLSDPTGRFRNFDLSGLMGLAAGGRVGMDEGGIMNTAPGMPKGMQVDGRNGTFIPMGVKEKADDVPAMLSKNEFVMTADAVKAAGGGSVNKGAQRMYDLMNTLEAMV